MLLCCVRTVEWLVKVRQQGDLDISCLLHDDAVGEFLPETLSLSLSISISPHISLSFFLLSSLP